MRTVIYYFTGTGNSLAISRDLAQELGECDIFSIPAFESEITVSTGADAVGIVYPVYAMGIPLMVERFMKKLELHGTPFVFTVASYALMQGAGITKAHRVLKRSGIDPKGGFGIRMPNSYLPFGEAGSAEKQEMIFKKAKQKVKQIAEAVRERRERPAETGFCLGRWLFAEPLCFIAARFMNGDDKYFRINHKCDGCGVCEKVCPAGNIEMGNGSPFWAHRCELCMACLSWCPLGAIEYGSRTKGKTRYAHPGCTVDDMLNKRPSGQ